MGYSPPGSSIHWDSPGKNTGVYCHALFQGIFPTQGSKPSLLHCRWILYYLSHKEKEKNEGNTTKFTVFWRGVIRLQSSPEIKPSKYLSNSKWYYLLSAFLQSAVERKIKFHWEVTILLSLPSSVGWLAYFSYVNAPQTIKTPLCRWTLASWMLPVLHQARLC